MNKMRYGLFAMIIALGVGLSLFWLHGSEQGEVKASPGIPAYSGSASVTIDGNEPGFTADEVVSTSYERYGELDGLGRCSAAMACIGTDLMPTGDRGDIGAIKPTGWVQNKYPGIVNSKPPYLYNRCHLIGYQLTGENANERNLITGTRYLNIDGMLPYENEVANYLHATGNHVMYRVTPVFTGDNLLCDGVEMEAYSVEDDGKGICFHVFCYNVQPGVNIDYTDGSNSPADQMAAEETTSETESAEIECAETESVDAKSADATEVGTDTADKHVGTSEISAQINPADADYVLNTNTKKFHYPSCESVSDMKEKNKQYYEGSRDELIRQGYEPCKRCEP